jgi:hypothetical protein
MLPNAQNFVNVVRHLRDFGRFKISKKLKTSHEQVLGVLQIIWEFLRLSFQNPVQEIRQNRGILNRVRLSWTRHVEACIANDVKNFELLL